MGAAVSTEQHGFSLMETMIALGILAVVAAGVLPLGIIAAKATENQGHLNARTTEYAQDKLEQLMALAYGDSTSDTTVFPAVNAGGTGLTKGGSVKTNAPAAGYVDYLDINGNVLAAGGGGAAPANWYYMRAWQISSPRANLKQITVIARVNASSLGGPGLLPQSTVSALKTFPF
jgi:prepilin-type N-terminal cleavage/methylation domain-containing protein